MKDKILKEFHDSIDVKERFVEGHIDAIIEVSKAIASASMPATRSSFSAMAAVRPTRRISLRVVNRFKRERPGLPA